jgi:sirohydrochlorin cobaltochelatase
MGKVAMVLVGHGSVLSYNRELIESFCKIVKDRGVYDLVECSFLQLNEPLLGDVLMKLAGDGIDKVIVSPVFIAKGVHTNSDITEIIERVRNETGMKIGYADPLGADPRIVDILLDRARDAESRIE